MSRLLAVALLFASAVFAQVEIPHVHENGDVIDADEINENFDTVAKAVPPQDCSANQIIKWNGSAWVCSSPEIVRNNSAQAGDQRANCPDGKKVTGGGCNILAQKYCNDSFSAPVSDLSGWMCSASGPDGPTGPCIVQTVYAICQ
jgi:hypothetical protein